MRLVRVVVRLPPSSKEALTRLLARCCGETRRPVPRAALVRLLVDRGLAGLDEKRPIAEQLPLDALVIERQPALRPKARGAASLRSRILQEMEGRAEDVFTPASLLPLVGAKSTDSVRNTLLVLADKGQIEKLGPGQYRAWRESQSAGGAVT